MKTVSGLALVLLALAPLGCANTEARPGYVHIRGDVLGVSTVAPPEIHPGIYEVVASYENETVKGTLAQLYRLKSEFDARGLNTSQVSATIASVERSAALIADSQRTISVTRADLVRWQDDLTPLPGARVDVTMSSGTGLIERHVDVTARAGFDFVESGVDWVKVSIAAPDRVTVERVFLAGGNESSIVAILEEAGRAPHPGR